MRTRRRALAACAALALFVAACGDDDDAPSATGDPVDESTDTSADEGEGGEETAASELTVTVGEEGIELSEEEIAGGAVEVTLETDAGGYASADFARVEPGTSPEQFVEAFAPVLTGGPIPDLVLSYAGLDNGGRDSRSSTMVLEPGDYIVWTIPEEGGGEGEAPEEGEEEGPEGEVAEEPLSEDPAEGEAPEGEGGGGPPPEAFQTATLTVTEGGDATLPETDNSVTAVDYGFEVDISDAGEYTFVNDGPEQFHHAVFIDFGSNPADLVEENLVTMLESDGEEIPEGIDDSQINFELGADTGVFSPGGTGVFDGDFLDGNTYAVVCFISDKSGGPPHAIANDMYEVFQVGG